MIITISTLENDKEEYINLMKEADDDNEIIFYRNKIKDIEKLIRKIEKEKYDYIVHEENILTYFINKIYPRLTTDYEIPSWLKPDYHSSLDTLVDLGLIDEFKHCDYIFYGINNEHLYGVSGWKQ